MALSRQRKAVVESGLLVFQNVFETQARIYGRNFIYTKDTKNHSVRKLFTGFATAAFIA
jgi:hypothetical protein